MTNIYLLPGALVLAAAALNLLGPGGGRRRASGCPLLLLGKASSLLLTWKSRDKSAVVTCTDAMQAKTERQHRLGEVTVLHCLLMHWVLLVAVAEGFQLSALHSHIAITTFFSFAAFAVLQQRLCYFLNGKLIPYQIYSNLVSAKGFST